MKVAVLAANGRSGRAFVARALQAGLAVRAGVHHMDSLPRQNRLEVVRCDATDAAAVAELVKGCDVVVSFIGHVKGSPARVQRDAMRVLVSAMRSAGITRVVSLTGTGVRFDGDIIGPVDWFLNTGIAMVDPNRVRDGIEHVEVLKSSGLDWTVIRVLKLQSWAARLYVLRAHGPTRWHVNRDEVANAVLNVLNENSFIREAPILSKAKTHKYSHGA